MLDVSPYPLFLNLCRRHVLIVGGGRVAFRKAEGLVGAGARVTVVSPAFDGVFLGFAGVTKRRGRYTSGQMGARAWRLVFAATDDGGVNARVYKDAAAAGILCCRCDVPERGDFFNGSTGRVGQVTLAISTAGASPTLAARLRAQAAGAIDPVLAELAGLHRDWRGRIKKGIATEAARAGILRRLAGEEMEGRLRQRGRKGAEKLFNEWLAAAGEKAAHAD